MRFSFAIVLLAVAAVSGSIMASGPEAQLAELRTQLAQVLSAESDDQFAANYMQFLASKGVKTPFWKGNTLVVGDGVVLDRGANPESETICLCANQKTYPIVPGQIWIAAKSGVRKITGHIAPEMAPSDTLIVVTDQRVFLISADNSTCAIIPQKQPAP